MKKTKAKKTKSKKVTTKEIKLNSHQMALLHILRTRFLAAIGDLYFDGLTNRQQYEITMKFGNEIISVSKETLKTSEALEDMQKKTKK